MVRNKRLTLRLSFIIVIAVALFGGWYANNHWQIDTDTMAVLKSNDQGDWVDFFANLGEGTIQLFLGFTSEK
jgi:hypothetical protein